MATVHCGVFRIAGHPVTWRQQLIAACLAWGPDIAVSHRAAAALWGLLEVEAGLVEVTTAGGGGRAGTTRAGKPIVHRGATLERRDVAQIDGIPVTRAMRTIVDLAAVVPEEQLEEALDEALRRRLFSVAALGTRLSEAGGRRQRGGAKLRSLLAARGQEAGVPQSVFETKLRRLLRNAGLPEPISQYRVDLRAAAEQNSDSAGRPPRHGEGRVAVLDFAYPDARLAIEADGYRWHSGKRQ